MKWWVPAGGILSLLTMAGCGTFLARGSPHGPTTTLPAIVAQVNGVAIHRRVVVQAEAILKRQRLSPQAPRVSARRWEAWALGMVIQQVVLAQAAQQRGLDPTVPQAIRAYQHFVSTDPAFRKSVKSTGSTATHPSAAWIQGYQALIGGNGLIRHAVGTQGSGGDARFIQSLVRHARVVLSPGVPKPAIGPPSAYIGLLKERTAPRGCSQVLLLPVTTASHPPCGGLAFPPLPPQ